MSLFEEAKLQTVAPLNSPGTPYKQLKTPGVENYDLGRAVQDLQGKISEQEKDGSLNKVQSDIRSLAESALAAGKKILGALSPEQQEQLKRATMEPGTLYPDQQFHYLLAVHAARTALTLIDTGNKQKQLDSILEGSTLESAFARVNELLGLGASVSNTAQTFAALSNRQERYVQFLLKSMDEVATGNIGGDEKLRPDAPDTGEHPIVRNFRAEYNAYQFDTAELRRKLTTTSR